MGSRGPIAAGRRRRDENKRPQPSRTASPEVVVEFRRIVKVATWIGAADAATVETLAESIVLQREAFNLLMPGRLLVIDKTHGNDVRRNPALIAWRTAAEVGRICAAKLALSPMDRARLGLEEESDKQSLAEVLFDEVIHHAK